MMRVEELTPNEWQLFSSCSYSLCFSDMRDAKLDRIDFAFMALDDEKPLAYMTVKEMDRDTVYLQHGGSFMRTEKSVQAFRAYAAMLMKLKERYKKAFTFIDSENVSMLRIAMKAGFRVCGVRSNEGRTLVEHKLNF